MRISRHTFHPHPSFSSFLIRGGSCIFERETPARRGWRSIGLGILLTLSASGCSILLGLSSLAPAELTDGGQADATTAIDASPDSTVSDASSSPSADATSPIDAAPESGPGIPLWSSTIPAGAYLLVNSAADGGTLPQCMVLPSGSGTPVLTLYGSGSIQTCGQGFEVTTSLAIWQIIPLSDSLYAIENWGFNNTDVQCLIFGSNGSAYNPSLYNWGDPDSGVSFCGLSPSTALQNLQFQYAIYHVPNTTQYVITNASSGAEECVSFGPNGAGTESSPSRYLWDGGGSAESCGFTTQSAFLTTGHGWTIIPTGATQ